MSHFYGVLANSGTVLLGSLLGLLIKNGIPERITKAIMTTLGLCVIAIGITGILKDKNQLVMVVALVLGVIIGSLIDIDKWINKLGDRLNTKFQKVSDKASISEGFVTASLVFCVGAMTIVGSINAGVSGDNQMLYTKALLDGICASVLATSLGVGVAFSALFVFVFQGGIVLLSMWLGTFLGDFAIAEIVSTGSVMIMAIGLNMVGITKIKVANMMPALVLVPFLSFAAEQLAL